MQHLICRPISAPTASAACMAAGVVCQLQAHSLEIPQPGDARPELPIATLGLYRSVFSPVKTLAIPARELPGMYMCMGGPPVLLCRRSRGWVLCSRSPNEVSCGQAPAAERSAPERIRAHLVESFQPLWHLLAHSVLLCHESSRRRCEELWKNATKATEQSARTLLECVVQFDAVLLRTLFRDRRNRESTLHLAGMLSTAGLVSLHPAGSSVAMHAATVLHQAPSCPCGRAHVLGLDSAHCTHVHVHSLTEQLHVRYAWCIAGLRIKCITCCYSACGHRGLHRMVLPSNAHAVNACHCICSRNSPAMACMTTWLLSESASAQSFAEAGMHTVAQPLSCHGVHEAGMHTVAGPLCRLDRVHLHVQAHNRRWMLASAAVVPGHSRLGTTVHRLWPRGH